MIEEAQIERSYLWGMLLIAITLHAFFISWVRPVVSTSAILAPELPGLSFRPRSGDFSRALYSPVLFALPTPMGFSASMLNQPLHSDPPIQSHTDIRSMVQVEERLAVTPRDKVFPDSRYPVEDILDRPLPLVAIPESFESDAHAGLTRRLDGPEEFVSREPKGWSEFPDPGAEPWLAQFNVELNKDSRIRSVILLERPAKGPTAEALTRWMYQQGFQAGRPVSGRVVVRWIPPIPEGQK